MHTPCSGASCSNSAVTFSPVGACASTKPIKNCVDPTGGPIGELGRLRIGNGGLMPSSKKVNVWTWVGKAFQSELKPYLTPAITLLPGTEEFMPATRVSGDKLKSLTEALKLSPGCTYEAAIVST